MKEDLSKKLFKNLIKAAVILIGALVIVISGFFIITGIKRADQHAKIKLTDDCYLKATLDLKAFPGQSLVLWLNDQDNNFLGSQNIDEIIGGFPIDYVESRNDSWKQVELVKDENGTKVFEAIWGKIIIDENKDIVIEWKENELASILCSSS